MLNVPGSITPILIQIVTNKYIQKKTNITLNVRLKPVFWMVHTPAVGWLRTIFLFEC